MKKALLVFLILFTTSIFSQELQKYDYAEVIVLQKVAKDKSVFKQIYLNSSTENSLDKSKIEALENNSKLLLYMNSLHWEYVDRLGSQPSNSGPIWINYIFRKKK